MTNEELKKTLEKLSAEIENKLVNQLLNIKDCMQAHIHRVLQAAYKELTNDTRGQTDSVPEEGTEEKKDTGDQAQ